MKLLIDKRYERAKDLLGDIKDMIDPKLYERVDSILELIKLELEYFSARKTKESYRIKLQKLTEMNTNEV